MIGITVQNTIYIRIQVSRGPERMAKLYRIGQVAREVGASVETIRRYADRGLVPYELLGDQRIFDERGVEKAREMSRRKRSRIRQPDRVDS